MLEPSTSLEVRTALAHALHLDLIGPGPGSGHADECLPGWERPSVWYLTGFLVPTGTPAAEKAADDDDFDGEIPERAGLAEESAEHGKRAKRRFFPSSMGLSFLVRPAATTIRVTATWGDYRRGEHRDHSGKTLEAWLRTPRAETVDIRLDGASSPARHPIPNSDGLVLHAIERPIPTERLAGRIEPGTRAVSVFIVNERLPMEDRKEADQAYAFQASLSVECELPFHPRPDLSGGNQSWDVQVTRLHYADTPAYATGHGVSADWDVEEGECRQVGTTWIGSSRVEATKPRPLSGVELSMGTLGALADGEAARNALSPLASEYRRWIEARRERVATLPEEHRGTALELLRQAGLAVARIDRGVDILATDLDVLDAFRVANRAVGQALSRRIDDDDPHWRPFQLAFLLLNLPGMANPESPDREIVDLLFFPTGGGKTEAYLGLAALAMVLRRLRNPEQGARAGAGVSVIMRYTLRLLTLDQLSRAAGLVCALELEREKNPHRLGEWPFEVGLWVGKAATPNKMGRKGDSRPDTARSKTIRYQQNARANPSPIPVESCPWCGNEFTADSFTLLPDADRPRDLRVVCTDFECDFSGNRPLPIVGVDEPLYRRLPAFLIATVDKFAALPWEGPSGALLGGAERYDSEGFYGPAAPGAGSRLDSRLPPPEFGNPGRAPPDHRPVGDDDRPLRDRDRGTLCGRPPGTVRRARPQAQDRRLDRHRPRRPRPGAGGLRARRHPHLPAPGAEPARLVLRGYRFGHRGAGAQISGHRGGRTQPESHHETCDARAHGGRATALPTRGWAEEP